MARTIWVLGDQLNRQLGALRGATPGDDRVLLVESEAKLASKPFHRQRLHVVVASMRRFVQELQAEGFEVDHRQAASLAAGLAAHRAEFRPHAVVATEPLSRASDALLRSLGVELVRSEQFLCHRDDFAAWAASRKRLRMEDFYRWQRTRLGYLMDGPDQPAGGRWNFDHDNREPPPKGPGAAARWPTPEQFPLDALDAEVVARLPAGAFGAEPAGWWPTTQAQARARLDRFVAEVLPGFGPHEDAMLTENWHLGHSLLSSSLNLGLLLPGEVCDAVEAAYRAGNVPLNSAEGFIRQVIGWREYVWGLSWLWPDHVEANVLHAHLPLPPAFLDPARTEMRCVATAVTGIVERGWVHHIQRLMVLANLGTSAGVEPRALVGYFWAAFVDGAEWVMVPNVIGMGTFADGGRMSTKPYVSGGAYLKRMSDSCRGCRFDPGKRTGPTACPFTTLYWDFLARHRDRFARNPRLAQQVRGLDRLSDLPDVRAHAVTIRQRLVDGEL